MLQLLLANFMAWFVEAGKEYNVSIKFCWNFSDYPGIIPNQDDMKSKK